MSIFTICNWVWNGLDSEKERYPHYKILGNCRNPLERTLPCIVTEMGFHQLGHDSSALLRDSDCSTAASPDLAPLQAAVARRRHPPSSWSNALLLLDSSSRSVDKMGRSRYTGAHDLSYHLVAPNGPCRIGPICHCPPKIVPYLQVFLILEYIL